MLNGEATCSDCRERRTADGYCERLRKHVPRKKVVTKQGQPLCGGLEWKRPELWLVFLAKHGLPSREARRERRAERKRKVKAEKEMQTCTEQRS